MKKFNILAVSVFGLILGTSFALGTPVNVTGAPVTEAGSGQSAMMYNQIAIPVTGEIQDGEGFDMMSRDQNGDWGMNNYGNRDGVRNQGEQILRSLAPAAMAGLVGVGIIATILFLLGFAFWVWMLVHAIKHDIDYKPVWILVLFLLNIWGAIVYYFAIKRPKDCYCCESDDCCGMCEEGECVVENNTKSKCEKCGNEVCVCEITEETK